MVKRRPASQLTPPLKWHGGKHYLAKRIIALMPPHTHYVEPYFGGGAVLLAKNPEGTSEVVNDINGNLINFWMVLREGLHFAGLRRQLEATPFSEAAFFEAVHWFEEKKNWDWNGEPDVSRAYHFFVYCRHSMSGRMDCFTPTSKTRTRRGMNEQVSAWLGSIEGLADVHTRLKRVLVMSREATTCIQSEDSEKTLFYVDPPYLKSTRTAPDVYAHEMSEVQHAHLLQTLGGIKGKFLLSGYRSTLYNDVAEWRGWRRVDFDLPNNSGKGATKQRRIESIWKNF